MLTRAGFGDDAPLAHAPGEQGLTERIVDLVRAGMREVFALEEDARAARHGAQPRGFVQRRRPAHVVLEQVRQFALERHIVANGLVGALELFNGLDQRFRHVLAAKGPEVTASIGVAAHWSLHRVIPRGRAAPVLVSCVRRRAAPVRAGSPLPSEFPKCAPGRRRRSCE